MQIVRRGFRLSAWIARGAAAWILGALYRAARRLLRRKPRIWFGPAPLHSTKANVASARLAGYRVRSLVMTDKLVKYALVTKDDFDVVLSASGGKWYDLHWRAFIDLLLRADVWVTYFDGLFFQRRARRLNDFALRVVRLAGIRIIVMPHGTDIIQVLPQRTRYDWVQRFIEDYPSWNLIEQTGVSRMRVELFSRHAHFVIASDAILARFMPRRELTFKFFPIDTDALRPTERPTGTPVVVLHAPNHRRTKGTDFLMAAIEELQSRGVAVALQLVEGVPREQALKLYAEADIIADQFCMGGPGVFAMEAMALGKPTLTYLDEDHLRDPLFDFPLVNANAENLTDVLAALIAIPELRRRIGAASRGHVARFQSIAALADVWDRIFRHVWSGEPLRLEETAHFSPERQPRSMTEDPLRREFWPVAVDDLMPQITAALQQRDR